MEYRLLGRSGLKVSTIAMGTMTFGRGKDAIGSVGLKEARRQIDLCFDHGVNLIDTANVYSAGRSEEITGAALKGKRADVILATKVRFGMGGGPNDRGLSRHHIINECQASLKRLQTDWIDLYQVHQWDGQTPIEEIMAALDYLVSAGHVRYIGCSNWSGWHIMKGLAAADRTGGARFVSQQIHYTVEAREAEYELVPISLAEGLGILVWSPLAGGLLTGKFRRGKKRPSGTRHAKQWAEPPIRDVERLYDIIEVIVEIAKARKVSGAQVALAWALGRPGVTSAIVGGRNMEQFEDSLGAADLILTEDERQRLDDVSKLPLIYPYWHQANTASDRLSAADRALLSPYL
ncbi:aldo/keto reductase [Bauldia sp.]|uniref:aldo/keto reductase n=1 Tax=Bauldia sp. TaxID=2575872 RepID=UPI003BAAD6C9